MTTDTSERGLERLICQALTGHPCDPGGDATDAAGGVDWLCGEPQDYNPEYCMDLQQLSVFLHETQPKTADALAFDEDCLIRRKFLVRLASEITKRGIIDVLRNGVKHGQHNLSLFCGTPSPGNKEATRLYAANRFSVTRQLRYHGETPLALDLVLFINGLPVATFELKNSLTKQTVEDAVQQYKRDRDPREKLFQFGRCAVHFALDDHEVHFCTHLRGKKSRFLPFNLGSNDGTGNPPNPDGIKTDYLWKRVLARDSLADILENYAQVIKRKGDHATKAEKVQIWPRYHQLDVVRKLLTDAEVNGTGKRYLIQHSAGSGKSNSIAWLAHQLIGLKQDNKEVFDSIIIVTDRRILDQQIHDTIKQFAQIASTIGHAENSNELRKMIEGGKKIIISTMQKFPFIVGEIDERQQMRKFAIIIDEAHSSQSGRASTALNTALANPEDAANKAPTDLEDIVNRALEKRMKSRKMLRNASYFAFTATPKNKTLEIFG